MFWKKRKNVPQQVSIDYDRLAETIVKAHERIKEREQTEQLKEQELQKEDWHKKIKYKEYDETKNIFIRGWHEVRNGFTTFASIIAFKRKYAESDNVTFGLMRMALSLLFGILKLLLYIVALILLLLAFYSYEQRVLVVQPIYILYSFLAFVFARLFRVAAYEVENMHDRQNLIGILSALSAFLALIVAIISLVVAVMK